MCFCIKGVSYRIEYSIFLLISLAILSGNRNVLYVILFSALHELGHIITLYAFKGKPDEIVVSYYGIGLKHSYNMSLLKEILFLSAGVIVNYALYLFNIHKEINISLAIINSLPIYPLDCGRIVKLLLGKLFFVTVSDKIYTFLSAIFVIGLAVYAFSSKNISLMIICVYTIVFAINNSID